MPVTQPDLKYALIVADLQKVLAGPPLSHPLRDEIAGILSDR